MTEQQKERAVWPKVILVIAVGYLLYSNYDLSRKVHFAASDAGTAIDAANRAGLKIRDLESEVSALKEIAHAHKR